VESKLANEKFVVVPQKKLANENKNKLMRWQNRYDEQSLAD
jgi:hypothetical protein